MEKIQTELEEVIYSTMWYEHGSEEFARKAAEAILKSEWFFNVCKDYYEEGKEEAFEEGYEEGRSTGYYEGYTAAGGKI